jgi:hypothetical protein
MDAARPLPSPATACPPSAGWRRSRSTAASTRLWPAIRAPRGPPAFGIGPDVGREGAQVLLQSLPPGRVHGLARLVGDLIHDRPATGAGSRSLSAAVLQGLRRPGAAGQRALGRRPLAGARGRGLPVPPSCGEAGAGGDGGAVACEGSGPAPRAVGVRGGRTVDGYVLREVQDSISPGVPVRRRTVAPAEHQEDRADRVEGSCLHQRGARSDRARMRRAGRALIFRAGSRPDEASTGPCAERLGNRPIEDQAQRLTAVTRATRDSFSGLRTW